MSGIGRICVPALDACSTVILRRERRPDTHLSSFVSARAWLPSAHGLPFHEPILLVPEGRASVRAAFFACEKALIGTSTAVPRSALAISEILEAVLAGVSKL